MVDEATEKIVTETTDTEETLEDQPVVKDRELSVEEELEEARAQAAEYLDGWQRARAELANFKRRTEVQRSEMTLSANSNLLTKLLPVLDDLQMALDNTPQEPCGSWVEWQEGISLVAHKFSAVLEEVGIVPIETEGQFFDPNIHEAISHEANPDFESGQIIAQLRRGYKLGNRVLRASMVRVAQ